MKRNADIQKETAGEPAPAAPTPPASRAAAPGTPDAEVIHWLTARVKELESAVRRYADREMERQAKPPQLAALTPMQIEVRDRLLLALLDLIPPAERAARRGRPALLRLIARTLRIKF